MKRRWYLTFHGGADRSDLNSVHVYSSDGEHVGKALDRASLPEDLELRELRGHAFGPDGDFYVANAFKEYSQIIRFHGTRDRRGKHSREASFAGGFLWVVDRDADCVRKYIPATGVYLDAISARDLIDKPIHLAADRSTLYIGNRGNESVVKCDLLTERVSPFIRPKSGGLKNPSGLAFGGDGWFYAGSRGTRHILRYRMSDGSPDARPFIDELEDEPEFLERADR